MVRQVMRGLVFSAALVACWGFASDGGGKALAGGGMVYANGNLFYNYYVGPGPGGAAAPMYVAPLPVPARVGNTYITYPPLMPHQFLYRHCRSYNSRAENGWFTRTMVIWADAVLGSARKRRHISSPARSSSTQSMNAQIGPSSNSRGPSGLSREKTNSSPAFSKLA